MSEIGFEDLSKKELEQLTSALIKSKLITKYNKDELFESKFDKSTINELINKPKLIKCDDTNDKAYVLISKDGSDERIYLDDFETDGIEATSDFISDYLPDFTFPVIYYDSEKAQKEAQAAYKSAVIIYSLDLEFKKYFEELVDNYDFKLRKHKRENALYKNFQSILEKLSADNTLIVKSLISACNYKIANFKKKLNPSFISELDTQAITELGALKLERFKIFRDYQIKESNVKQNWEKEKIRAQRDIDLEEKILSFGRIGQISKALKLNSECLSQRDKDRIFEISLVECQKFYNIGNFESPTEQLADEFNSRLRQYRRVSAQKVVDKYKMDAINKLLEDKNYLVTTKR